MLAEQPLDVPLSCVGEFVAEPGLMAVASATASRRRLPRAAGSTASTARMRRWSDSFTKPTTRPPRRRWERRWPRPCPTARPWPCAARWGRARRGSSRRSPRRPASTAAASSAPPSSLSKNTRGRRTIVHIDAYRLRGEDEFRDLGPDEFFEGGRLGAGRMGRPRRELPAAGEDRNPYRRDRSAIAAI